MTNIDLPKPQINYTYNDTISVLLKRLEILADVAKASMEKCYEDDYLRMLGQADRDLIKVLFGDVENDSRDVRL